MEKYPLGVITFWSVILIDFLISVDNMQKNLLLQLELGITTPPHTVWGG